MLIFPLIYQFYNFFHRSTPLLKNATLPARTATAPPLPFHVSAVAAFILLGGIAASLNHPRGQPVPGTRGNYDCCDHCVGWLCHPILYDRFGYDGHSGSLKKFHEAPRHVHQIRTRHVGPRENGIIYICQLSPPLPTTPPGPFGSGFWLNY